MSACSAAAHNRRLVAAGLCFCCGRDPWPYRTCERRRSWKRRKYGYNTEGTPRGRQLRPVDRAHLRECQILAAARRVQPEPMPMARDWARARNALYGVRRWLKDHG